MLTEYQQITSLENFENIRKLFILIETQFLYNDHILFGKSPIFKSFTNIHMAIMRIWDYYNGEYDNYIKNIMGGFKSD